MIKLYRRGEQGELAYHEAWMTDDGVLEHFGVVGSVGEHRTVSPKSGLDETANLEAVLAEARSRGYAELPEDGHASLVIEYEGDSNDPSTVAARESLEDELDEFLGWTGLGHCAEGSGGDGTIEVVCQVVDFDIASESIRAEITGTEFGDYRRIYKR